MFQVIQLHTIATPPTTYAPINSPQGTISPLATGLVGLAAGALAGAGYVASRKFSKTAGDQSVPGSSSPGGPGTPEEDPDRNPKS
jgi:hydrogenase small subunit